MTHVPWHEMADDWSPEPDDGTVELLSVGIDIGTTTTHLMLSALTARPGGIHGGDLAIAQRSEQYRSPVVLTPYEDEARVDAAQIEEFVERSYRTAGYASDEIDTGAVIVTGEARGTENAKVISSTFSERAGDFVCAMAGPNLEAVMSAHGSGAVDLSVENGMVVLHIDIGGGTTELALVREGFVEETASIRIGARLVELAEDGHVIRVQDPVHEVADELTFDVEPGAILTDRQRQKVAEAFVSRLFDVIEGRRSAETESLLATDFPVFPTFDAVTCSGGVSEYVYGRNPGFYDDLGPELGEAICHRFDAAEYPLERITNGIRATVSGSTQHSVQVSGSTATVTDETVLPLRNVPMVPFVVNASDSLDGLTEQFVEQLHLYDVGERDDPFAYGFHLHGRLNFDFLDRLATAMIESWRRTGGYRPLIMASDADVAMSVGGIAADRIDAPVIAVDNLQLDQFGYLDISDVREDTGAPLVTMKSLVF